MTTDAARRSAEDAPTVATLNEHFPSPCAIVQQVRLDYADWYYDLSGGYILYFRPGYGQHYVHEVGAKRQQRLVAERAYGPLPPGHVVRRLTDDRTDNRAENLRIIPRSELPFAIAGHEPAAVHQCAVCGQSFQAVRKRIERTLSGQLFCSPECRQYAQCKVERPTADGLLRLMQEIGNWTRLAQHFGVSDNAVRKWAKRYGLDLSLCDGRQKENLSKLAGIPA